MAYTWSVEKKIGRPPLDEDLHRKKITVALSPEEREALEELARVHYRKSLGVTIGTAVLRELARERKKAGK